MSADPVAAAFVQSLHPRISEILHDPETDLNTISAKKLRARLVDERPELQDAISTYKKDVDNMIVTLYRQALEAREPASEEEEEEDAAPEPPANSSQPLSKAPDSSKSDAEYARQLSQQWNASSGGSSRRATRNGASSSTSRSAAGRSGKGKGKAKISSAYVVDSDEEADGTSDQASSNKRAPPKKRRAKAEDDDAAEARPKKRGGGGGAFNKEWALSEPMAFVCDATQCSRPQVVKRIWAYVREHELQNPKDKREIICDEALTNVFGIKKVTAFSMNKYIGKHLYELQDA